MLSLVIEVGIMFKIYNYIKVICVLFHIIKKKQYACKFNWGSTPMISAVVTEILKLFMIELGACLTANSIERQLLNSVPIQQQK